MVRQAAKPKPAKRPKAKAKPKAPRRPPASESMLAAVEKWLNALELDDLGEARAALARTLAQKLDQLLREDAAAAALAVPGTSRELREVLDTLEEASDDSQEFVSGLFAEVGDSAQS